MICGALVLGAVLLRQVGGLDGRFIQPSWRGLEGLARYVIGDYASAAQAYRAHLAREAADALLATSDPATAAWLAFASGDAVRATQLARTALAANPGDVEATLTLAEVALADNAMDDARRLTDAVLKASPDQFDASLLASIVHARTGAFGAAIDTLNRALRYDRVERRITVFLAALETAGRLASLPSQARPVCLLAHYHRYLRIYDSSQARVAIRYARQAIARGDRPADAWLTIGVVETKLNHRAAALAALEAAVAANPRHPEALRWSARVYSDRGDVVNELRATRAAHEAAPTDPYYANRLHDVLTQKLGDYHQAIRVNEAALQWRPDDPGTLQKLGYAYAFIGDGPRALAYSERAVQMAPHDPIALENLGFALERLGRLDESLAAYRRAMAAAPGDPDTYFRVGNVLRRQKRYEEAIGAFEDGFALGSTDLKWLLSLCGVYWEASRFDRAEQCVQKVLAREPNNAAARHLLGETLKNLNAAKAPG